VLALMYYKVEFGILEEFLTEKFRDFEEFIGYVLEHIERIDKQVTSQTYT
jgi:uncharacterized protein YutE (UPF0331/DUF86 family)